MDMSPDQILQMIVAIAVFIFSVMVHENAHGLAAERFGDPTARELGRITLNPIPHIDPIGTVLMPALMMFSGIPLIGWAKPVPINPYNFRNPRKGMMWAALGGPAINFILAAGLVLVFKGMLFFGIVVKPLLIFLIVAIQLNVFLAVFNLIPIPPLDGGRVLVGLLPQAQAVAFSRIEPYGFLIVIALLYFDILDRFLFYPITAVLRFLGVR